MIWIKEKNFSPHIPSLMMMYFCILPEIRVISNSENASVRPLPPPDSVELLRYIYLQVLLLICNFTLSVINFFQIVCSAEGEKTIVVNAPSNDVLDFVVDIAYDPRFETAENQNLIRHIESGATLHFADLSMLGVGLALHEVVMHRCPPGGGCSYWLHE